MSSLFSKGRNQSSEDEKDFDQLDSDFEDSQSAAGGGGGGSGGGNNQSEDYDSDDIAQERVRSIRKSTASKSGKGSSSNTLEPYFDVSLPTLFEANIEFKTLFEYLEKGIIDLDPEFQREVVWTEVAQKKLINSIESNICIPPLIFNVKVKNGIDILASFDELEFGAYICCDGKQRLTSIHKFMKNEIAIIDDNKKSWYYDRIPKTTTSGKILSKSRREAFNSRTIGIACYRNLNRDQESLLFSRIQEGKALSYDEKLRATAGGQMASFIEKVVDIYYIEDIDDKGLCYNSRLINLARAKEFTSAFRAILNILDEPGHWSQTNLLKLVVERKGVTPEEEKLVYSYMDRFINLTLLGQSETTRKRPHKVWTEPKAVAPVELPWLPILVYKYRHFDDGDLLEVIQIFRKSLCAKFSGNVSTNPTVDGWIKTFISNTIKSSSLTHIFSHLNSTSPSSKKRQKSPEPSSSSTTQRRNSNSNASTSTSTSTTTVAKSTAIKRSISTQQISSSSTSKRPKSTSNNNSSNGGAAPVLSSDSDSDSNTPLRKVVEQRNSPRSNTTTNLGLNNSNSTTIKLSGSPLINHNSRLPSTLTNSTNTNATASTSRSSLPPPVRIATPMNQALPTPQGRAIASLPSFIRKVGGGNNDSPMNSPLYSNGTGGGGGGIGLGLMEVDRKPDLSSFSRLPNSNSNSNSNYYSPQQPQQQQQNHHQRMLQTQANMNQFNSQQPQQSQSQLYNSSVPTSTNNTTINTNQRPNSYPPPSSNSNSNSNANSIPIQNQNQNRGSNNYSNLSSSSNNNNNNNQSQPWPEPNLNGTSNINARGGGGGNELDPVYLARVNSTEGQVVLNGDGGAVGGNGGGSGNSSMRNFFPDAAAIQATNGSGTGNGTNTSDNNQAKTAAELLMSQSLI